jgi:hypothetical protein
MDPDSNLIETVCDLIETEKGTKKELIELLKKIPSKSRLKWTSQCPLISAVKIGKKNLVNDLIHGYKFDFNSRTQEWNDGNWCSLGAAIHSGNLDLARFFLAKGVDTNTIKSEILKDAIFFSSVESVKFLLEEVGTDVNFKMWLEDNNTKQFLPIHFAICNDVEK